MNTIISEFTVYGITLNRYAQTDMIGKPNNVKVFGSKKPMGLNRVAKIGYGQNKFM